MGKVTSLYGKTTGKIGSIVFATSGGETIAREYNPHVSNPNTQAQVNQRARMKLMSQLSAALAPVVAMTKEGLVSKRNKFVKRNFSNSYASDGVAQISYENVQITEGSAGIPQLIGSVTSESSGGTTTYYPSFALSANPSPTINRVVYACFKKTDEGALEFLASKVISVRQASAQQPVFFAADFPEISFGSSETATFDVICYAYGMSDTSESANATYGNLRVQNATDIARLVANRTISYEDYQFTMTRGATLARGSSSVVPTQEGYARVFVTALGTGGSVSGGGSFEIGTQVTVRATAAEGYVFERWIYNGTNTTASTNAQYTFTLNEQTDLVAVFAADGGGGL